MEQEPDWLAIASRVRAETFARHVEFHASLPSTNDRAAELAADAAAPVPAVVVAAEQTAGRGRGANVWRSGPGALTFSVVVEPAGVPRERRPLVSLLTGLAVRDAVAAAAPRHVVQVKWPNDVYLDGRKVCGILIEAPPGTDRLIVGVGVNVGNSFADAPPELRARAVSIAEATGASADAGAVLVDLLVRLESELREFARTGAFPAERWAAHCLLRGRTVSLRTPAGEATGVCRGVANDGALLLDGPDGLSRHYAGEAVAF